jgi:hypothetical protein
MARNTSLTAIEWTILASQITWNSGECRFRCDKKAEVQAELK